MKDIQVFTALDAKTVAAEKLDILLLSTEGAADMAIYNDLEKLKAAFPGKKVAAMADKMFNQDIFTYPSIIAYFFNRQLLRNLRRS